MTKQKARPRTSTKYPWALRAASTPFANVKSFHMNTKTTSHYFAGHIFGVPGGLVGYPRAY